MIGIVEEMLLEKGRYNVTHCLFGEKAIEMINSLSEDNKFDLILMTINESSDCV